MRKLREEVDSVLGDRPAEVNDLSKMPYLNGGFQLTVLPIDKFGAQLILHPSGPP